MTPDHKDSEMIDSVVRALVAARLGGTLADDRVWSDAALPLDQIYTIQEGVARAMTWEAAPGQASHWKSGGTPDVPTFARLPPPCIHPSPATLPASLTHRLGLEIEVAFRIADTLTPANVDALSRRALSEVFDAMTVSIELVDFRWQQFENAAPLLKLADLQSHGALVLGDWVPYRTIDWAQQAATLEVDGIVTRYTGSHPYIDPLWATGPWLRHAVARHGELAAGSVVTTGSWCGMVWQDGPAQVVASFEGIGEAALRLT